MMIQNDSDLRKYIPNVMREVKGEIPLFDKLAPYLAQAEQWLTRHFVPADMLGNLSDTVGQIVALEAYRLAIPQLDLVFTPNGFATVGSQNLSPASKMRVDRLVGGLLTERDKVLAQLLYDLPFVEAWPDTPQGRWFGATLFPTFDLCGQVGETERLWDKYCELRPQIVDLEASLAEEWFSPELMSVLRDRNLRNTLPDTDKRFVAEIQAQIIGYLNGGSFSTRRLADIVNFIRKNPAAFPEWHNSATAELFSPPIFKNKKNASGYFF